MRKTKLPIVGLEPTTIELTIKCSTTELGRLMSVTSSLSLINFFAAANFFLITALALNIAIGRRLFASPSVSGSPSCGTRTSVLLLVVSARYPFLGSLAGSEAMRLLENFRAAFFPLTIKWRLALLRSPEATQA